VPSRALGPGRAALLAGGVPRISGADPRDLRPPGRARVSTRRPAVRAQGERHTESVAGERGRVRTSGRGRLRRDGAAQDETRRDSDRLEASRLLADRGWGKAGVFAPQEGDPFDLEEVEAAAEEFRARVLRLAGGTRARTILELDQELEQRTAERAPGAARARRLTCGLRSMSL
jgi:hypothetical protein